MANSKYEYIKSFERPDNLLLNTWIVIRLDGRGFHKFSTRHNFSRPNDSRAIHLMNASAISVLRDIPDILLGYGVSDEFSFLFPPNCTLFERREAKLITTIVSTFTSYYIYLWPQYFPTEELKQPLPSFDARAVCYPTKKNVRDYFSWRQVDCHINNLYNTTFWALVGKGGMQRREAEDSLKGTLAKDKHEVLFGLGINYNNVEDIWKKGSVVFKELRDTEMADAARPPTEIGDVNPTSGTLLDGPTEEDEERPPGKILHRRRVTIKQAKKEQRRLLKSAEIVVRHIDIIGDKFWMEYPYIMGEGIE